MTKHQERHTIQDFKNFINRHPKLLEKVRKHGYSWQSYYEKWVLLGEDDKYWQTFKEKNTKSQPQNSQSIEDVLASFSQMIDKVDVPKVQSQVSELNKAIQVINDLLTRYMEHKQQPNSFHHNWFNK